MVRRYSRLFGEGGGGGKNRHGWGMVKKKPSAHMQMSDEYADLSEYAVCLEVVPGSPSDQDLPSPVAPRFGPNDLTEYEVQMEEVGLSNRDPAPSGPCVGDLWWVRNCVELLGYARGWVPLPSPSHSTVLHTMMQVDMSSEDQVVHGRASTEQT